MGFRATPPPTHTLPKIGMTIWIHLWGCLGGGEDGRVGTVKPGKPLAVRCCPLESELRALPVLVRTPPQGRIPQGSQTFSLRAPHSFWHPRLSLGWSQISFPDSSVSLGFWPHCTSVSALFLSQECPLPPLPHHIQGLRLTLLSFQSKRAVSTY